MKSRRIVIIRGLVTAGKTTTSHALAEVLPNYIFIDKWKIKEMFEPLNLKDRTPLKTISKKASNFITREVLKSMPHSIILQEDSISHIKKNLGPHLKNVQIHSFFLDLNDSDVEKRDNQRDKPTMGLIKEIKRGDWRKNRVKPEKGDIIINTSENSVKQVVNIILKAINEKPQKHPKKHAIRKSW